MRDDDDARRRAEEIAQECSFTAVQRFIRENFGLYHPPGDYKALREENLRRTKRFLNGAAAPSPGRKRT